MASLRESQTIPKAAALSLAKVLPRRHLNAPWPHFDIQNKRDENVPLLVRVGLPSTMGLSSPNFVRHTFRVMRVFLVS